MLDFPEDVYDQFTIFKKCNFQTKIRNMKYIGINKVGLKFQLSFGYYAIFGNISSRVCELVING